MAFVARCSRVWRSTLAGLCRERLASSSSLFSSSGVRFMSSGPSTKLFVGGLSFGTDDSTLSDAFSSFGDVIEAKIVMDRETGRSKGFGFVVFKSAEQAQSAMETMNGRDLNGRTLRVNFAIEKPFPERGFGGGGGGYGGGGYGGGGGSRGGYGGSFGNDDLDDFDDTSYSRR